MHLQASDEHLDFDEVAETVVAAFGLLEVDFPPRDRGSPRRGMQRARDTSQVWSLACQCMRTSDAVAMGRLEHSTAIA